MIRRVSDWFYWEKQTLKICVFVIESGASFSVLIVEDEAKEKKEEEEEKEKEKETEKE